MRKATSNASKPALARRHYNFLASLLSELSLTDKQLAGFAQGLRGTNTNYDLAKFIAAAKGGKP